MLPTWPCALTSPGMTVLPASATRSAPAGTVTLAAGPTETMRPSRTTMVALSIGARVGAVDHAGAGERLR